MDHLAVGNWMFSCVNSGEDGDPPEFPKPVPRPAAKEDGDEDGTGAGTSTGADAGARTGATGADSAPRNGEAPPEISPGQLARFFG
ncbi:hypothetical protein ACF1BN_19210 [Streptomyces sp. NPDC014861]|uniref:hypothetical protein n=1 Tax=Streptomyces sp. NPDC014861 TaxID=3364923 RepID=UPI0036F65DAF